MLSFPTTLNNEDITIEYKMGEIFGFNDFVPNLIDIDLKQGSNSILPDEDREDHYADLCFKHFSSLTPEQQRSEIDSNK